VQQIRIGQRYRKVGGAWTVWQVVDVAQEQYGIRHYRISDAKDPSDVRLISEKALADRKFYQLIYET
jgi:hypothetical protein